MKIGELDAQLCNGIKPNSKTKTGKKINLIKYSDLKQLDKTFALYSGDSTAIMEKCVQKYASRYVRPTCRLQKGLMVFPKFIPKSFTKPIFIDKEIKGEPVYISANAFAFLCEDYYIGYFLKILIETVYYEDIIKKCTTTQNRDLAFNMEKFNQLEIALPDMTTIKTFVEKCENLKQQEYNAYIKELKLVDKVSRLCDVIKFR